MRWGATGVVAGVLGLGCGAEVDQKTWVPIDVQDVRTRLDEPTATIDALEQEVIADLEGVSEGLVSFSDFAQDLFSAVRPETDAPPTETPDDRGMTRTRGTSFYIRWSCPGRDLDDPVLDFDEGSIFVDSPALDDDAIDDIELQGDLLLTIDDCRIEDRVFRGESPAFYRTTEPPALLVDFEVSIESETEQESLALEVPVEFTPRALRYSIDVDDAGTVTVVVQIEDPGFSIVAADGALTCDDEGCEAR